jgi:hypothetical protein
MSWLSGFYGRHSSCSSIGSAQDLISYAGQNPRITAVAENGWPRRLYARRAGLKVTRRTESLSSRIAVFSASGRSTWSLEAADPRFSAKSDVHEWAALGFSRLPLEASGTAFSLTMVSTS